jgi:beta-lactamase class A
MLCFSSSAPQSAITLTLMTHALLLLLTAFQLPPQKSDAIIGVAALHVESGRRVSIRGDERFPMGSVYKFPIALTVLRRVDEGKLSLDQELTIEPKDFPRGWSPLRDGAHGKPITLSLRELLRHMVSNSDNTASDALLRLVGPRSVSKRMEELGVGGIRVDRSEAQLAADLSKPNGHANYALDVRDTSTPEEMATLLFAFHRHRDGLTTESHDLLARWMTESTTGAHRIRAAVPPGAVVMHKTGTMPGTTNDAAIVTSPDGKSHIVLVIFSKGAKTASEEAREADVASVAKAAYEALMK